LGVVVVEVCFPFVVLERAASASFLRFAEGLWETVTSVVAIAGFALSHLLAVDALFRIRT